MNRWEYASTEVGMSCHTEHIRCAQWQLREMAGARVTEMLRCAQDDKGGWALLVTLSEAKGLARGATRCFAALSMTKVGGLLFVTL